MQRSGCRSATIASARPNPRCWRRNALVVDRRRCHTRAPGWKPISWPASRMRKTDQRRHRQSRSAHRTRRSRRAPHNGPRDCIRARARPARRRASRARTARRGRDSLCPIRFVAGRDVGATACGDAALEVECQVVKPLRRRKRVGVQVRDEVMVCGGGARVACRREPDVVERDELHRVVSARPRPCRPETRRRPR